MIDGLWLVSSLDDELDSESGVRSLTIVGLSVSGFGGVNRFNGKISDAGIVEQIATTLMTGAPEEMERESRYFELLTGSRMVRESDQLVVSGATGEIRLTRDESSVSDWTWRLVGYDGGNGMVATTPGDAVLEFQNDLIVGNTGCNRFRAGYRIDGKTISVAEPMSTRMACRDEEARERESAFLKGLAGAETLSMDFGPTGRVLDLLGPEKRPLMRFAAEGTRKRAKTSHK